MKKSIVTLLLLSIFTAFPQCGFAENIIPANTVIKTASTNCAFAKSYRTSTENLMYLLLSALNEHNYSIEEIQFKTGSVLFKAYTKEFIASVSAQDGYNSFIKIIPADNVYNFSPVMIQKLHTYIDNNNKASFQKLL